MYRPKQHLSLSSAISLVIGFPARGPPIPSARDNQRASQNDLQNDLQSLDYLYVLPTSVNNAISILLVSSSFKIFS